MTNHNQKIGIQADSSIEAPFISDADMGDMGAVPAPDLQAVLDSILIKAGREPQTLYRGYQMRDNKDAQGQSVEEKWKYVSERDSANRFEQLHPMFATVLASTYRKDSEDVSRSDALSLGHFAYFDFDFDADSIDEVLPKVRQFIGKLTDAGADATALHIYASGGKGFHVMVPLEMFLPNGVWSLGLDDVAGFHQIIKEIAFTLNVDTLDMRVYTSARMWRQANVKRVRNTYKVPVAFADLVSMDADRYAEMVSASREDIARCPAKFVPALGLMWVNARDKVRDLLKVRAQRAAAPRREVAAEEIDRYSDALWAIDPDAGGYGDWFSCVAATNDLFDGSDQGFALVDGWSKQGSKYSYQALLSTWEGLDGNPAGGSAITAATVYQLAYKAGWEDKWQHLNPNHNPAVKEDATPVHNTEVGMAEYLMRKYADQLLYIMDLEMWYFWDGKVWQRDDDAYSLNKVIKREGRLLRERIGQGLKKDLTEATEQGDKEAMRKAQQALTAHIKFYDGLESARTIDAVKKLMKAEVRRVTHQALDAEPFLLNVQNGVVDLRTGELLQHTPERLMSKITSVPYNVSAPCPNFQKFIFDVSKDRQEWVDYVQLALGYSLSGDMAMQKAFFQGGQGSNGKSTLNNTLLKLLGTYAQRVPVQMLMVARRKAGAVAPSPQMMNLPGTRIVFVTEAEDGNQLNEGAFKNLVSTDPLPARNLFAKRIAEIRPQFKLWPAFNELPKVASTLDGVWRRIVSIPFDMNYSGADKDKRVYGMEDILSAEGEGILAWCVDGFRKLWKQSTNAEGQRIGWALDEPECLMAAKERYRRELDIIWRFVDDCLVQDEPENANEGEIPATMLYAAYANFCQCNNLAKVNSTRFGRDIAKHLTEKRRNIRGNVYYGWRILDVWVTSSMKEQQGNRTDILTRAVYIAD
ncbi:phage/plasmid primase, P4 family [Pusillimonas sp. ANT_WB101]|uniref:phage/plasmid primase, P4 family n=1 Tax=Pusillimonas sp. ANT_WB101 TaxID=2597356 RepID=UPI0011EC75E0|nr:phage/plasmid primase, P4 family [Pusillimonas sp. ANT_WB101]KAA0888483.1 hypothetical protein FQ179_21185 [Pusillimonas sp. ANT_WB101]